MQEARVLLRYTACALLVLVYILLVLCCISISFQLGRVFLVTSAPTEAIECILVLKPTGEDTASMGSGFGLICLQVFRFLLCDRHLLCTTSTNSRVYGIPASVPSLQVGIGHEG